MGAKAPILYTQKICRPPILCIVFVSALAPILYINFTKSKKLFYRSPVLYTVGALAPILYKEKNNYTPMMYATKSFVSASDDISAHTPTMCKASGFDVSLFNLKCMVYNIIIIININTIPR